MRKAGDDLKPKLVFNLNDGLLAYGKKTSIRDPITRKYIDEVFKDEGHLYFDYRSLRQSGYFVSDANINKSDIKVVTYYNSVITESHKVVIEGIEYDIVALDVSDDKWYMYWYLQRVGKINDK